MLKVRDAATEELSQIMKIYEYAQDYMIRNGNPTQWGHSYPDAVLIRSDIEKRLCKVVYDAQGIHGAFVLLKDGEPNYEHIEGGQWLNNDPYLTIHRVAGDGQVHGIFSAIVEYCSCISGNIRIDTHADNLTMQRCIEKNGFTRCGVIYVEDGTPRFAYQRTEKKSTKSLPIGVSDFKTASRR